MVSDLQQRLKDFQKFADATLRDLDRLSVEQQALLRRLLERIDAVGIEEARRRLTSLE